MTKKLPRRDARRRLSLQELYAIQSGEERMVATFGSLATAREIYDHHRHEFLREGWGRRPDSWWRFEGPPELWTQETWEASQGPELKERQEARRKGIEDNLREQWRNRQIVRPVNYDKRDLQAEADLMAEIYNTQDFDDARRDYLREKFGEEPPERRTKGEEQAEE